MVIANSESQYLQGVVIKSTLVTDSFWRNYVQMKHLLSAAVLTVADTGTSAFADDQETVTKFYDLLSNPGQQAQVDAFQDATSDA